VARSRRAAALAGSVAALVLAGAPAPLAARAAPAGSDEAPAPIARPVDPDAATPRMRAPDGQAPTDDRRRDLDHAGGWSSRRRVHLGVTPLYSAFRMAFMGRPAGAIRGGGVALDLDIHLVTPVWLRISASYTGHPVQKEYAVAEDDSIVLSANAGAIHTADVGGGVVFAMDLGRVIPMLEAGLGVMVVSTPKAAQDGQRGAACLEGGGCDVGLFCAGDNVCHQGAVPELHAGAALEILLKDRWTLGASLRYYALLLAPTVFPIYLQAGVRLGVRF
jgi:hypothetical protein